MSIEVVHPGALTTVQDLGRRGFAHLGVAPSGAADPRALRLANRLLGNGEELACLETTLLGPRLRFHADTTIVLTGADAAATLDGQPLTMGSPVAVPAGALVRIGTATRGLRTYLAVRGGIDCERVLGSRSTDIRSGLGPAPLRAGDTLLIGTTEACDPGLAPVPVDRDPEEPELEVVLGPREDRFTASALTLLLSEHFTVNSDCDRVGVRLSGAALTHRPGPELRSEALLSGAIQVPPDGQPIILLADHPTTGGYPVIAVVHSQSLPLVGQLRPGQRVRFRTPGSARKRR